MAVTFTPTAGTKVQVSADAPATLDAAGYEGLAWTDVAAVDNIPSLGGMFEMQTFDAIAEGRTRYRGIADIGEGELSMADKPADPGQVILKAAFDAAKGSAGEVISYRVIDQNGSYFACQIKVGSWRKIFGGANDLILRSAMIAGEPLSNVEATES